MTDAVCPYCRCPIDEAEQIVCSGCGTPHHQDCYAENGGCTVFGCSAAPPDEAKMSVSTQEVASAAPTVSVTANPAPTYMLFPSGDGPASTVPPPPFTSGPGAAPPPPPPPFGGNGAPPPPRVYQSTAPQFSAAEVYNTVAKPRDRVTFILLGVFLGCFGVHNFYAGYHRKAAFQLCLTVLTCFYGAVISFIWSIVEVCIVKTDSDGVAFS